MSGRGGGGSQGNLGSDPGGAAGVERSSPCSSVACSWSLPMQGCGVDVGMDTCVKGEHCFHSDVFRF